MKVRNKIQKIELPDDISRELSGNTLTLKGKVGSVTKTFVMPTFTFSIEGNSLTVSCDRYGVYEHEKFRTIKAHVRNMIKGAREGYTYKLKVCSSHFPMSVTVNGNKLIVKNMFGEKIPRQLVLREGTKVRVTGDIIDVTGTNIEIVGQVAADIEKLTRITNRDRRIFQDGIYIFDKAGKEI